VVALFNPPLLALPRFVCPSEEGSETGFRGACAEPTSASRAASREAGRGGRCAAGVGQGV